MSLGTALETMVREALRELEHEDLEVSFGTWEDDGEVQLVCKVETPPGDPLSSEPPWRWWSPLFRTPDELREELAKMVARRLRDREVSAEAERASDEISAAVS